MISATDQYIIKNAIEDHFWPLMMSEISLVSCRVDVKWNLTLLSHPAQLAFSPEIHFTIQPTTQGRQFAPHHTILFLGAGLISITTQQELEDFIKSLFQPAKKLSKFATVFKGAKKI